MTESTGPADSVHRADVMFTCCSWAPGAAIMTGRWSDQPGMARGAWADASDHRQIYVWVKISSGYAITATVPLIEGKILDTTVHPAAVARPRTNVLVTLLGDPADEVNASVCEEPAERNPQRRHGKTYHPAFRYCFCSLRHLHLVVPACKAAVVMIPAAHKVWAAIWVTAHGNYQGPCSPCRPTPTLTKQRHPMSVRRDRRRAQSIFMRRAYKGPHQILAS